MTWNYRVLKETEQLGRETHDVFKVISVYYEDGKIVSWADTSTSTLVWNTYDDLAGTMEYVLLAFQKPVLELREEGLVPLSEDPEPAAPQRVYIVEHRDFDFNYSQMHYASSWGKAVKWMDDQVPLHLDSRDDFHYAIYSQALDADDDTQQDLMLFGKDGEPFEDESDE